MLTSARLSIVLLLLFVVVSSRPQGKVPRDKDQDPPEITFPTGTNEPDFESLAKHVAHTLMKASCRGIKSARGPSNCEFVAAILEQKEDYLVSC